MTEIAQASYKIKRFTSPTERDFLAALKIYNETIPVETKTSTNEISHFAELQRKTPREMYYMGLYFNDKVVGYIQAAYLCKTKTIMLDYVTMKKEYRLNGVFYPLFSLFQQFFSDNLVDYDYIVTEVSMRSLDENVDDESYYSRRLLKAEDFRILNIPYPQPQLGINNYESNFEMRLMIKSINAISSIKSDTILTIIEDIYINHYINWYSEFLSDDELNEYKDHVNIQLSIVKKHISEKYNDYIILTDGLESCEFYMTKQCHYSNNGISTAGFAKNDSKKKKISIGIIAVIVIIITIGASLFAYFILDKASIPATSFAPLLTAITSVVTCVVTLILSSISKK